MFLTDELFMLDENMKGTRNHPLIETNENSVHPGYH